MAGTNNEDELLILSDDSDTGSDFVLNEQVINDNTSSTNDMISFDTGLENMDITLDPIQTETKLVNDNSNDFSFSIEQETEIPLSNLDVKENYLNLDTEKTDSSDFSFSLDSMSEKPSVIENTQPNSVETVSDFSFGENLDKQSEPSSVNKDTNGDIGTMTDIIDEAISKFLKREDLIGDDISLRESHVNSLKNDISELEKRVSLENEEISKLNIEKQAILKNRKSLEKMKESPVSVK